jgi:Beta-galactosidase/beta-glucuronidase
LSTAQTISFNQDWKFIGIEIKKSNNQQNNSMKLGSSWESQFIIEKVNKQDSLQKNQTHELSKELNLLKGKQWQTVCLPHAAFIEPVPDKNTILQPREGFAYYKKSFTVDNNLQGKIITIEFEAAMQITDVWVNGKYIAHHDGGYLPFTIDITHLANYGGKNEIFCKLDNRANPVVPPGKDADKIDFLYYSGLYRNVWMHINNPLHITDANVIDEVAGGGIFVTYQNVSENSATINIQTHIINENKTGKIFSLVQKLIDKTGKTVEQTSLTNLLLNANNSKHFQQSVTLKNPLLWHPDHPYLYKLQTIIEDEKHYIINEVTTKIGIRSFYISKETGLLINGKPFKIEGSNRHQNYPYIGNALSDNANYRDAFTIKSTGMNCIRLGHYPQSKAFLNACDELGILTLDCIPGWQFFNKSPLFEKNVMNDIRQTIRRDRNHPCIVLWEMSLNETYPSAEFRCEQNNVAKSEFIGKENFYTSGDSYFTKACWDVPYDDWNDNIEARNNTTYPDNAFLIREYGDCEFGCATSTSRQVRGNGEKALLMQAWNHQWTHNRNRALFPRCLGDLTWAFYDGLNANIAGIEAWGSADLYRIPKFSYYFFQSQRSSVINKNVSYPTGPMVYIANYWTERESPCKVVVYSNCDEVALYLNDKLIAKQKPDNKPDSPYKSEPENGGTFDGGNAEDLEHPPFTFFNISYEKGTIKAVGFLNGKEVAANSVTTPEVSTHIALEANYANKNFKADGGDVIFIYAKILDENGTLCVNASNRVKLQIQGDAKIISPVDINAEAGIATFMIQAGTHRGNVKLKANAEKLKTVELILNQE